MSLSETSKKSPGSWLPGVIISILVIIAFVFIIDWQEFLQAINQIKPSAIVVLLLLTLIPLVTRSLAWRSLLDKKVSLKDTFFGENIGYLLNNFLPFRLGEIARSLLLSDRIEGGFAAVLPSVFVERLIDLCFAAIVMLVAIPFVVSESWMLPTIVTSFAFVVLGVGFLFLSLKKANVIENIIEKLFSKFPKLQQSLLSLFQKFIQGLISVAKGKNLLQAVFFLLLTWAGYLLSYYLLIRSVAPQVQLHWAFFTNGVVSLGIAIPSAPGSLGIWEASFVAALAVFNVSQSQSLAIAIVMHLMSYIVTGVLGMIGFTVFGSSFSALLHRVQNHRKQENEIIPGGE